MWRAADKSMFSHILASRPRRSQGPFGRQSVSGRWMAQNGSRTGVGQHPDRFTSALRPGFPSSCSCLRHGVKPLSLTRLQHWIKSSKLVYYAPGTQRGCPFHGQPLLLARLASPCLIHEAPLRACLASGTPLRGQHATILDISRDGRYSRRVYDVQSCR